MSLPRTPENGYYKLKSANKWMHFSMPALIILKKDTGKDIVTWAKEYDAGDAVSQYEALCQIAFAGLKAFDLAEHNEIDYNEVNVQNWMGTLTELDSGEFQEAMSFAFGNGKKKTSKK